MQKVAVAAMTEAKVMGPVQAGILGFCWLNIANHHKRCNPEGIPYRACPKGRACTMNHDNPESFDAVRVDVCCLALESTTNNYKKKFVDKGEKGKKAAPKSAPTPGGPSDVPPPPPLYKDDEDKEYKSKNNKYCTYCKSKGEGKKEHHQQDCPDNPDKALFCYKCLVHGHVAIDCNKDDAAYETELTTKVEASIKENCASKDAWGMLETERPAKMHHFTPGKKTYWADAELALR